MTASNSPDMAHVAKIVRSVQPHLMVDCKAWRDQIEECGYWLKAASEVSDSRMTLEQAVTDAVKQHGGVRATERATGLDKSFISRLMRGEKVHPSDETLSKLGLRAVPLYEKIT